MSQNSVFLRNSPLLYLIADRHALDSKLGPNASVIALIDLLRRAAVAGVDMIQIREKDLGGKALFDLTTAVIEAVRSHGAKVLVNDRVDVALATDADGIHLATTSLPGPIARDLMGDKLIGVSTHSLAEVAQAEAGGADFVVFGPIFPTASKAVYGPPIGFAALDKLASKTNLPVLALGGVTEANYDMVLAHGASGIAGISLFTRLDSKSMIEMADDSVNPDALANFVKIFKNRDGQFERRISE